MAVQCIALKPLSYIVKLRCTGFKFVCFLFFFCFFFLMLTSKHRLWVLVRTAQKRRFSPAPKIKSFKPGVPFMGHRQTE